VIFLVFLVCAILLFLSAYFGCLSFVLSSVTHTEEQLMPNHYQDPCQVSRDLFEIEELGALVVKREAFIRGVNCEK
jgi:hypothetical protein